MDSEDEINYPTMDEPAQARYQATQRGAKMLIDPYFYQYHFNKSSPPLTHWACIEKRKALHCKATASTDEEDMIVKWGRHNHEADSTLVKVRDAEQEILEMARKHPKLSTHHIVGEWQKATNNPEAQGVIMDKQAFRRKTKRVRAEASGHPDVPLEFHDFANLPEKYQRTFDQDRHLFSSLKFYFA